METAVDDLRGDGRSGNPRAASRVLLVAAGVGLPLLAFVLTLSRDVTFIDSGELTTVAALLGIAHPPSYPLFTLLGHILSLLPFGTVAFRVGLLSALSTVVASLALSEAARTVLESLAEWRKPGERLLLRAVSLVAGLSYCFSSTVWSQSVVVEVYALQGALVSLFLLVAVRMLCQPQSGSANPWLLSLLFGLTLTNHLSGLLLFPAWALTLGRYYFRVPHPEEPEAGSPVGALQPGVLRRLLGGLRGVHGVGGGRSVTGLLRSSLLWKVAGIKASGILLPLLLYAYLPIRSRMDPPINWDYPETWHRFWVHVTARQYHGALAKAGPLWFELVRFLTTQLPEEMGRLVHRGADGVLASAWDSLSAWGPIALAVLGIVFLLVRSGWVLLVLASALGPMLVYNMAYRIHDIRLYYIPPLAIVYLFSAVGAGVLVALLKRRVPLIGLAVCIVSLLVPLHGLVANWDENDYHDFHLLRFYIMDALKYAEPGAVVFSGEWDNFVSPALYVQKILGYRDDVKIISMGRIASATLGRLLRKQGLGDIVDRCTDRIDRIERTTEIFERGGEMDLNEARGNYLAVRKCLVDAAVAMRPTYVTSETFRDVAFRDLYKHTEGLLARLRRDDEFYPFPMPEYRGPGVRRSEVRAGLERHVFDEYARMCRNRAKYLERHGHLLEAEAWAELASAYAQ